MKRILLLAVSMMMLTNVAMADHIGIYSDATGTSCLLGPAGQYNPNAATIIHRFSSGASGSYFDIHVSGGSLIIALNGYPNLCDFCPGIAMNYNGCLSPSVVLGTITAILAPGYIEIVPAPGQSAVGVSDCNNVGHPATGGRAYVGGTGECTVPTESATWGSVKALYR